MQLFINAFNFKVLVLFMVAVLAFSVSTMSTMKRNGHGHGIGNTDVLKLMPNGNKTRETTPRHFLAKRSPLKKLFKIPLIKKGLLVTKKGLLAALIG